MQTDADAFLIKPLLGNLVTTFEQGGFYMGARSIFTDDPCVMWGLAELTKYFIMTEGIYPATLFDHCIPNDITGLFSR